MICTTCNRSAERGYLNIAANEWCCDPCHGPHLIVPSSQAARFIAFHGPQKARRYMHPDRGIAVFEDRGLKMAVL